MSGLRLTTYPLLRAGTIVKCNAKSLTVNLQYYVRPENHFHQYHVIIRINLGYKIIMNYITSSMHHVVEHSTNLALVEIDLI